MSKRCKENLLYAIKVERQTLKYQWERKPTGRCRQLLRDVETELKISENFLKKGKFPEAIPWFQTAAKSHGAFIWCISEQQKRRKKRR